MYISASMLAFVILGAFSIGVVTPIVFVARTLSRRSNLYSVQNKRPYID